MWAALQVCNPKGSGINKLLASLKLLLLVCFIICVCFSWKHQHILVTASLFAQVYMAGDVPEKQFYARKDKTTNAKDRVCHDIVVGAKRTRLDSNFVGGGVYKEGTDSKILPLDDRDRISNLPQDIVHCILERLSVDDAARTSVLSKEWSCKWGMKTNLVLDELFFLRLISNKDKDKHQSAFSRAIEMIILVHKGPLLSFNFYIPPELDQCLVSRWMKHFLSKSIRLLEITNSEKNAYEIPLFVCEGLAELKLTTGILNQLPKPGSFTNLIRVKLRNISITANISFGSQLKGLYLHGCTGIQYLGCQFTNANNLKNLLLQKSEQIEWQWFECTKQLKFLGLALTTENRNTWKPGNVIKLLSNTQTISELFLSGYTVEVLGPLHSMPKGLAPKIANLSLIGLGFYNSVQISNSLRLIRCSPNLRILQIVLEPGVKKFSQTIGQLFEPQSWKGVLLEHLHTVVIHGVVFQKTVVHVIKLLLASSPSLKVMLLYCNIKANACANIRKIREELLQCPKKSLSAKVYLSFQNPHIVI